MKKIIVSFLIALSLSGCWIIKPAAKTANELARILCEEYATGRDLTGMTAKDWCKIQKNLYPFVDAITGLEQSTGLQVQK